LPLLRTIVEDFEAMKRDGLGVAASMLALLLATTGIGEAGEITGTVRDTGTNTIAWIWVDAYDTVTNYWGITDDTGDYTISGLTTGVYYVRTDVSGINYIDEWYDNVTVTNGDGIPAEAQPVAVTGGVTTANIDFALELGGAIAGTVSDTSTNLVGLSNIWVDACDASGESLGDAVTDANGDYEIVGLFSGSYYVRTDSFGQNYADEWFDNVPVINGEVPEGASPVLVSAGWTTNNVDFALAVGATFSGTVVDSNTQTVSDVWVDAYTSDGEMVRSDYTDVNGNYAIVGLPDGVFHARTYVGELNYVDEWYDDVAVTGWDIPAEAAALFLTSGVVRTDIDFSLADGGRIAGTVTNMSGTLLAGIDVDVYTEDSTWTGRGTTDTNGNYAVQGLLGQAYYLRTEAGDRNYIDEWYDDVIATDTFVPTNALSVAVTSGATAAGIDIGLAAGGIISGTITDAGSAPLAGPEAHAFDAGDGTWMASGATDTGGMYAISGLPSGAYKVRTYATPANYADEWYVNIPVADDLIPDEATEIPVTAGLTNSGIDFALADGATISGRVVEASQGPATQAIAGAYVEVYNTNGVRMSDGVTAYDGTYAVSALAADTYYARVDVGTMNYIEEWYSNVVVVGTALSTNASPLTVATGATLAGVDFALDQGGSITGEVLRGDFTGIADISVDLYTTDSNWFETVLTADNGAYSISGLPAPGPYYVRTFSGTEPYVDEWFDDVWALRDGIPSDAQAVAVVTGSTAGVASFVLEAGGLIEGTVRDEGGSPIVGIGVTLVNTNGQGVWYETTEDDGTYSLGRAPASTYYVRTDAGNMWFFDEWYDDVPVSLVGGGIDPAADAVPVTNGGLVAGVDFVLRFPIVDAYADNDLFALYWQGVFGTTYQVERSPDLSAWTNAPSGTNADQQSLLVSPVQGIIRYEDPEPLGSNNYYRIEIIP